MSPRSEKTLGCHLWGLLPTVSWYQKSNETKDFRDFQTNKRVLSLVKLKLSWTKTQQVANTLMVAMDINRYKTLKGLHHSCILEDKTDFERHSFFHKLPFLDADYT